MELDLRELKSGLRLGALVGASVLGLALIPASTIGLPRSSMEMGRPPAAANLIRPPWRVADFGTVTPTDDARWLADWVADARDNGNTAFLIVDKRTAQLHVFDADAIRVASTPILLGAATGDGSVPGIGSRPMASIDMRERTTPAGRFVGERGRNASGEDVVWVDYDAAVSLHRVRLTDPAERRAERLASPSAADNRISYGCINVPVAFYERYVQAIFVQRHAVIYVLPDDSSAQEVFGPYLRALRSSRGSSSPAAGRRAHVAPHPATATP